MESYRAACDQSCQTTLSKSASNSRAQGAVPVSATQTLLERFEGTCLAAFVGNPLIVHGWLPCQHPTHIGVIVDDVADRLAVVGLSLRWPWLATGSSLACGWPNSGQSKHASGACLACELRIYRACLAARTYFESNPPATADFSSPPLTRLMCKILVHW